jgi:hypothetical protein
MSWTEKQKTFSVLINDADIRGEKMEVEIAILLGSTIIGVFQYLSTRSRIKFEREKWKEEMEWRKNHSGRVAF